MNLRDIEYFCAICDFKSYTKASEYLHLSQPSLTLSVNRLESELDVDLFKRSKRQKEVTLTAAGGCLYLHAKEILAQVEKARADMRRFSNTKILFGLPPIVGAYFFPPILASIMKKKPDLQFEILEEGSSRLIEALKNSEIDMAVITTMRGQTYDFLEQVKIGEDRLAFCFSKEHPWATRESVDIQETADEEYILLDSGFNHHSHINSQFEAVGIQPTVLLNSSKMQTIKYMVASGLGISLMMEMALKSYPDVAIVPATGCETGIDIWAVWKKNRPLSPAGKLFLQSIVEEANWQENASN